MTFAELVKSLGDNIGLRLSDNIASPLEIKVDELTVTLTEEQRGKNADLVVSADLGAVPQNHELEAYRVMLDANVFWTATADCTLGVNAQTREAVICYRSPIAGLDGLCLAEMLDVFIYAAGNWANFIEGLAVGASDAPASRQDFIFRA